MASLLSEDHYAKHPLTLKGDGHRLVIYGAYGADAVTLGTEVAPLDWNPTGVGAVEEGRHRFYERQGDGPERLVGQARFSVLWRLEGDGRWRLARAFSIHHEALSPQVAEPEAK